MAAFTEECQIFLILFDRFLADTLVTDVRTKENSTLDPETRESLLARLPDHADTAAWEEFAQLYQPLIYGIGRRHGLQPHDASDLVQDVLIAVADCIDRFEPNEQRGRFRTWLFRIARNQSLLRLRKLRREVPATATGAEQHWLESSSGSDGSDQEFDIAFRRRAFRYAARKVRQSVHERTWEAFSRTAIDCQSAQVAADEMGIEIGAVYLSRSRVMKRLRALVQDLSGECLPVDDETHTDREAKSLEGESR